MIIHFLKNTHIIVEDRTRGTGGIDACLSAEGVVDLRAEHHITHTALTGDIITEVDRQLGVIEFRHVAAFAEDMLHVKRHTVVGVGHRIAFSDIRIGESIEECGRTRRNTFCLKRCGHMLNTHTDTGLQEEVLDVELI